MEELGAVLRVVIGAIFRIVFELLLQGTGNLLIRVLSFGRARGAPIIHGFFDVAPFFGGRAKDGTFVVGSIFAMIIGGIFWLCIVGIVAAARQTG